MDPQSPNEQHHPNLPIIHGLIKDHFKILAELGRGAFSKVYAVSPSSDECKALLPTGTTKSALKVVDLNAYSTGFSRSTASQIIQLELRILSRIHVMLPNDEHIVKVYGILVEPSGERAAIIMEELTGGELFDSIVTHSHSFNERDAANIIRIVAQTLKNLHQIGIVHRDVKPENLIYVCNTRDAPLRLVDFGLARINGESDPFGEMQAIVGTLGYVAPEIITSRIYTEACDVWSLGVILFILVSGVMPFGGQSPDSIVANSLKQQYDFAPHVRWTNVSNAAKNLIKSMLVVDMSKRCTLDDVLSHPWLMNVTMMMEMPTDNDGVDFADFFTDYKSRTLARNVMLGARFGLKSRLLEILGGDPGLSLEQLQIMLEGFRNVSSNHHHHYSGRVTLDEYQRVMQHYATKLPLNKVFRLFDRTGQGTISYVSLLSHLASIGQMNSQIVEFCFHAHDVFGVGLLSRHQIAHLIRNLLSGRDGLTTQQHQSVSSKFSPLASFCAIKQFTSDLEMRLCELFVGIGNDGIDMDMFMTKFVHEPVMWSYLTKPLVVVPSSSSPRRRVIGFDDESSEVDTDEVSDDVSGIFPSVTPGQDSNDGICFTLLQCTIG